MGKGAKRSENIDLENRHVLLVESDENFGNNLAMKLMNANTTLKRISKEKSFKEIAKTIVESSYDILILDVDLLGKEATVLANLAYGINSESTIIGTLQHDEIVGLGDHMMTLQKPFPFHMLVKMVGQSEAERLANKSHDFSHLKILVVEDVEMNLLLVKEMFKTFFHATFSHAKNGEVAVDMVKNSDYDIVFMDIQMPIMDGITATKEIRKFNTKIPIHAMTANALAEDSENAIKAGMNGFITKPVKKEEVQKALNSVLSPNVQVTKNEILCDTKEGKMGSKTNEVKAYFESLGFDEDALSELIDSAILSIENELEEITKGYESKSVADIRRAFHSLKGILLNINSTELAATAAQLESALKELQPLESIEEKKEVFVEALHQLLQELK